MNYQLLHYNFLSILYYHFYNPTYTKILYYLIADCTRSVNGSPTSEDAEEDECDG